MSHFAPSLDRQRVSNSYRPFEPLFQNAHVQTVVGRYWPTGFSESRYPSESRYFSTEPGVKVLAHCSRHATGGSGSGPAAEATGATVVAVHGLTSSSQASYMRAIAQRALDARFDVVRLNVRNCCGTEHLAPTLYHSGLTADLHAVVEQLAPAPVYLVGFSMGGNMALKLAAEWGEHPPCHVRAICGVSVPIELEPCARRLGSPSNRVYEVRFLRELRATLRRKQQLMPELFAGLRLDRVRSIYEFDDVITAPAFGFRDAEHYYACASSGPLLGKVRVPVLLLQAEDDPFIPFETYQNNAFNQNPFLDLRTSRRGGHVAFLSKGNPRFWAIEQAVEFFNAVRTASTTGSER